MFVYGRSNHSNVYVTSEEAKGKKWRNREWMKIKREKKDDESTTWAQSVISLQWFYLKFLVCVFTSSSFFHPFFFVFDPLSQCISILYLRFKVLHFNKIALFLFVSSSSLNDFELDSSTFNPPIISVSYMNTEAHTRRREKKRSA